MKKFYYTISTLLFFLLSTTLMKAQNIRFSFDMVHNSSTTTTVSIYAQTTTGTENLTGYTIYLYYDNTETTVTGFDSSPTTGTPGLAWSSLNQSSILHQAESNSNIGITHSGYFFYQNFDNAFIGNNMTTTPTLLLTIDFDHTVGSPTVSGSAWLAETDEVPPLTYVSSLFQNFDVITTGIQSQALPIELTNFGVRAQGLDAILNWTTASEIKASHFEIERSIDGHNWVEIGAQATLGKGPGRTDYNFTDSLVYNPGSPLRSFYYRLKMVDVDGQYDYSSIENVTFSSSRPYLQLEIFPNPTSDYLNIRLAQDQDYEVELYDIRGKLILRQENESQISLGHLQAGTYMLRVLQAGRLLDDVKRIVLAH